MEGWEGGGGPPKLVAPRQSKSGTVTEDTPFHDCTEANMITYGVRCRGVMVSVWLAYVQVLTVMSFACLEI